jgi:hypothetical protein
MALLALAAAWLLHSTAVTGLALGKTYSAYLPLLLRDMPCPPLPVQVYLRLSADSPGPSIAADQHPDHNPLEVRGYAVTQAQRRLVTYGGTPDSKAPQFHDLFALRRLPAFSTVYRANSWDWENMRRGPVITSPAVTVLGLATSPGEVLYVPDSGYTIGSGAEVLVIYARRDRVTLKYTREDNVVRGYTLSLGGICTDATLLALYNECDAAGRDFLPALLPRQAFGRAAGQEILVAIADTGTLMDPRSRRDWWQGY